MTAANASTTEPVINRGPFHGPPLPGRRWIITLYWRRDQAVMSASAVNRDDHERQRRATSLILQGYRLG